MPTSHCEETRASGRRSRITSTKCCPPSISTAHIYRGIIPFVILQLACVIAAFVWQDLVLWLPEVVYGAD